MRSKFFFLECYNIILQVCLYKILTDFQNIQVPAIKVNLIYVLEPRMVLLSSIFCYNSHIGDFEKLIVNVVKSCILQVYLNFISLGFER